MAFRIGVDIVYIPRIAALVSDETALLRVFTKIELEERSPSHLAGIFAAKESVFKAIGVPPCWLDIEIKSLRSGKPIASLASRSTSRRLEGIRVADLSISHDGDYAIAVALVETLKTPKSGISMDGY